MVSPIARAADASTETKNVRINSREIVSVKGVAWLPRSRASGPVRIGAEIGMDLNSYNCTSITTHI